VSVHSAAVSGDKQQVLGPTEKKNSGVGAQWSFNRERFIEAKTKVHLHKRLKQTT
jgi:hypothetical protein